MSENIQIKRRFRINKNDLPLWILVGIIILASIVLTAIEPNFLSSTNIFNILQQNTALCLVTLGAGVVLLSGNIDLSVGNMLAVCAVIGGKLVVEGSTDMSVIIMTLLIGIVFGIINGIIVTYSKVDSFIITLGLLSIYQALALILCNGNNVYLKGAFNALGNSKVGDVPLLVILLAVATVIMVLVMKYTKFSRRIYAIGGNEEVAFLAGIKINLYKIMVYTISGLFSSLGGLVVLSRIGQATPAMGGDYALQSITAAVIGGIALSGGRGKIIGAILGGIMLGLITNALNMLRVPSYYQYMVLGIVIIAAVIVSNLGERNKK